MNIDILCTRFNKLFSCGGGFLRSNEGFGQLFPVLYILSNKRIKKYFELLKNIQGSFGNKQIFQNIPGYSRIFQNIPEYSRSF